MSDSSPPDNDSDFIYVLHGCNGDIYGTFKSPEDAKKRVADIYNGLIHITGYLPSDPNYFEITMSRLE